MSNFEWFLLVAVVIVVPLVVAIVVTLWTLEMARQRKRSNRPGAAAMVGVKRNATRARTGSDGATDVPMLERTPDSRHGVSGDAGSGTDGMNVPAEPPGNAHSDTDDSEVDRGSGSTV